MKFKLFIKVIEYIKSSSFFKNIFIVMSGTAVSQILGFGLTPVISRLFSPSDFGIFGSCNSVIAVVAAGVTLQYSQAIMLPKHNKDAANVFALSMISVVCISVLTILISYLFSNRLLSILNAKTATWLIWFLPFAIFINGNYQSLQAWCVRRKAFNKTAASQVIRAGVLNTLQIITGFLGTGSCGLITSNSAADGFGCLYLARQLISDRNLLQISINFKQIWYQAKEYFDFPIFSASQNFLNALCQGLPVIFLAYFFGTGIAGAYAFSTRILQAPMNLFHTSFRQVFYQKASEDYNFSTNLLPLFVKTTSGLFIISIVPSIFLFIWAPEVFSWVFGTKWYIAGVYSRWLVLWLMTGFCNVPSVLLAKILRQQRNLFILESIISLARIITLVFASNFFSALETVIIFSVLGASFNVILIMWILFILNKFETIHIVSSL